MIKESTIRGKHLSIKNIIPLLVIVLAFCAQSVHAQKEVKYYKNAEDAFYAESFRDAFILYTEAMAINPNYKDAKYKREICHLLLQENREEPLDQILSYINTKGSRDKFYYYWLGRIYTNRYMFAEAVDAWHQFLNKQNYKSKEIVEETKLFITKAEILVQYFDNPDNYEIHQMDGGINSSKTELSPVYYEDTKELLFVSDRQSNKGKFEVFQSSRENYDWAEPTKIPALGLFDRNTANIEAVNADGKLFVFDNGLKYSQLGVNKSWTVPIEFDSKIHSKNLAAHFFINPHEDRIIFASDDKANGLNLYESYRNPETKKWTDPVALPATVNSPWDEDSPYLSNDEKSLYFSSNQPGGVGGYDIYVSTFDDNTGTWGTPTNLGWPINSPDDETHLKMNDDQGSGYFVSNRIQTRGDFDIFFFWKIEKAFVEGRVLNALTEEAITSGEIRFHPSAYLMEYFRSPIDSLGRYRTEIISDETFRVEVISGIDTLGVASYEVHDAQGDLITHVQDFYAVNERASKEELAAFKTKVSQMTLANRRKFEVQKPAATPATPIAEQPLKSENIKTAEKPDIRKNITIKDLGGNHQAGTKAVLSNIYFDFGTSNLTSSSEVILEQLYQSMKANPFLKIEIGGHTDNIGYAQSNIRISQNRANAVKIWLLKKGVSEDRLKAKGYGESQPLASNDDEINGRELNRRIEIVILK